MITSKNNTLGFWTILVLTALMLIFLLSVIEKSFQGSTNIQLFQLVFPAFGVLVFGSQIWRDASFISIDTLAQSVTFSNFFTCRKRTYYFLDLNGFVDMEQKSSGGTFRVVYLVRDHRYVEKISSFYYSNLDEIQNALTPTKYLGKKEYSFFKSIDILLKKKVND